METVSGALSKDLWFFICQMGTIIPYIPTGLWNMGKAQCDAWEGALEMAWQTVTSALSPTCSLDSSGELKSPGTQMPAAEILI